MVIDMKSNTILSMIIVLLIIFGMMTFYKLDKYPKGDCCQDISNPDSKVCFVCEDYNIIEKIIYVWKYT